MYRYILYYMDGKYKQRVYNNFLWSLSYCVRRQEVAKREL